VGAVASAGAPIVLCVVLALGACLRLCNLIPVQRGLEALQDYDEAVWDGTAQLMLQGFVPYRDFFATLPPLGIYLLAAVLRVVYVPWGSGLGLMATRYASVAYGLVTIGLVYAIGNRLAGRTAALVAAALLAVDGMVVGTDRMAMLEAPLNLLSCLAVLGYLAAFERPADDRKVGRAAGVAGAIAAAAALAKTPGAVVVLSMLTVSALRRRWREAAWVMAGFVLTWLVLCAPFLVRCSDDFVKQVYFFQFLRPPDGIVRRLPRLYDIWRYAQAWLTLRLGAAGTLVASLVILWRKKARRWLIILAWAGYTLLLILANSSYYPQYYVQLAVPLCLLAGALFARESDVRLGFLRTADGGVILPVGMLTAAAVLVVGLVSGGLLSQPAGLVEVTQHRDSTYTEVASYIQRNSHPAERVLAFEPNYAFLASRPLSGANSERFLVDSYGEMLYVNMGIQERSLSSLTRAMLGAKKAKLQSTFWQRAAQDQVLAAFRQAEYVVIDGRARYQLEPRTLVTIQEQSSEVLSVGVATLRKRS
jgi:hypothetical protein